MSSSVTNSKVEGSGDGDDERTATEKLVHGHEHHSSEEAEQEFGSDGGTLGSPTSLPFHLYPSPVQLPGLSLPRSSSSEAGEEQRNEDVNDNERLPSSRGCEHGVDAKGEDEDYDGGGGGDDGEADAIDVSGTAATILTNISPRPNRGSFQLYPSLSPVHLQDSSLRQTSALEAGEEKSYEDLDDNDEERSSFSRGFEHCAEAKYEDDDGVDVGDDFEPDALDTGDAATILPGISPGPSRSGSPDCEPSPSGSRRVHENQEARQPPPLEGAGLVSSWFYSWAYPLLRTGMDRPIQESDLPGLMEVDTSSYNRRIVEDMWRDEVRRCESASEAPPRRGWLRRRRRRGSDDGDCDDHGVANASGSGATNERTDDVTASSISFHGAGMAGRRRRPWRRKPTDPDCDPNVGDAGAGQAPAPASSRPTEDHCRRRREQKQRPSLARAVLRDYIKATWFAQILLVVSMASRLVQAIALGRLVEQFDSTDGSGGSARAGYAWSGVLILCGAAFFLAKQRQFFITYRKGMHLRIGLVGAIYCKSLRLSSTGGEEGRRRGDKSSSQTSCKTKKATGRGRVSGGNGGGGKAISSGQVLNLASNDVERFIAASTMSIYLVYGPLEALAVLVTGLSVMGPAFAAGYALLFVFVPLQFYAGKKFALLRSKVAAVTDSRVSLVSQAVSGARVMKMSGWECQFEERIRKIRDVEMRKICSASRYKAWNEATHFSANVVISVVTFSFHVLAGGTLTSRIVFTTMSLVNILQSTVAKMVSQAVMSLSECYVSTKRIQNFLQLPELPPMSYYDAFADVPCTRSDSKDCVPGPEIMHLVDVTCYWNDSKAQMAGQIESRTVKASTFCGVDTPLPSSPSFAGEKGRIANDSVTAAALCNVTLRLNAGILYCVIGSTGCGKSGLLQAMAGELRPRSGTVERRCVGRRGSEGSSRFLAYAPQDSWIMDGSVRENILFGLMFDRGWYDTVVNACGLSVDLARFASGDKTVVGDRGVQCSGGQRARIGLARALYRDAGLVLLDDPLAAVDSKVGKLIYYSAIVNLCLNRGKCVVLATHQHQFIGDNTCILMDKGRVLFKGSYSDCIDASGGKLTASLPANHGDQSAVMSRRDERSESLSKGATMMIQTDTTCEPNSDGVHKEERTTGLVSLKTWRNYANAMGGVWVGIGLLFLFAVTQTSALVSIIFIGKWAERPPPQQDSPSWLGLVFGLATMLVFLSVVRARSSLFLCIKASQRLHDRMTRSVLRAKIEFFDTNPLGRILNRFSADIGVCDDLLPLTIYDFLVGAFSAFGSVATAVVVLPFTLLAIPPLLWCFVRYRKIFVTTTRELKRLEGLARSPIYALIGEAPGGIATIRSNDAADYFRRKFEAAHDAHTRAFFAFVASSRWFAIRMDMIAYIFMSIASLLAVLFQDKGWFDVDPATIGLTLTMLLQMAGTNFPWVVRQSAEVVNFMVSVERVSGYGELPCEAALVTDRDEQLKNWPRKPSIVVTDLTVRYRSSLPPALSGVTFKIDGGQKVGVVGRTGSGKSSLVQALFRILEAEAGTIEVDGEDISKLGLHKVRTQMSVIPQAPVLFGGCSILENLDPFRQFHETTVRSALSDVQLLDTIDDLPAGIHSTVSEGGSNFSVGQRQLLCLARAILQRSKILVLDEPTANVDSYTETLLQEAIGKRFVGATLISVAHRLDTIIDHDLVLVLGEGEVLEYGSPVQLLSLDGHFASMVDSTGEEMAANLRRRAQLCVLSPLIFE